jgi:hypothetical protein
MVGAERVDERGYKLYPSALLAAPATGSVEPMILTRGEQGVRHVCVAILECIVTA